jgi:hypothetical protein
MRSVPPFFGVPLVEVALEPVPVSLAVAVAAGLELALLPAGVDAPLAAVAPLADVLVEAALLASGVEESPPQAASNDAAAVPATPAMASDRKRRRLSMPTLYIPLV